MRMMKEKYDLAGKVIGFAMRVHRELGAGFNEQVYKNSLIIELADAGFQFDVEKKIKVYYREKIVGDFSAEIIVYEDDELILELKAVQNLVSSHEVQLVNYLTATRINTGLLLNFGADSLQFKRKFRQQSQACDPEPTTLQSSYSYSG
jgi:GxxExxY protein